MTVPGAPGLYLGDELFMGGENDPFCRGAFDSYLATSMHQPEAVAELTALRRRQPSLRTGTLHACGDGGAVVFERSETETVVVSFNATPAETTSGDPGAVIFTLGDVTSTRETLVFGPFSASVDVERDDPPR